MEKEMIELCLGTKRKVTMMSKSTYDEMKDFIISTVQKKRKVTVVYLIDEMKKHFNDSKDSTVISLLRVKQHLREEDLIKITYKANCRQIIELGIKHEIAEVNKTIL